ncbi:hypothetical protein RMATCC62417_11991 [Rhizopus microsporus]|nr:hypothetical protein RMATCC62417_11991 [Rhizopus microsporus]
MPWPAQSPDLSPIENQWSIMKKRVNAVCPHAKSSQAMEVVLKSVWRKITPEAMSKRIKDAVILGPDSAGQFVTTSVKGIHRKRVNVPAATAGQSVTLALKNIRRNAIRKGQVLLTHDKDQPMPKVSRRFEAEILVLYHSTTIKSRYQAMVHCGAVRQTASIITAEKEVLRTGDRAKVEFEFVKNPEYLTVGSRLIFREGRTKGIGKITRLL